jgi:hypothetical protein
VTITGSLKYKQQEYRANRIDMAYACVIAHILARCSHIESTISSGYQSTMRLDDISFTSVVMACTHNVSITAQSLYAIS